MALHKNTRISSGDGPTHVDDLKVSNPDHLASIEALDIVGRSLNCNVLNERHWTMTTVRPVSVILEALPLRFSTVDYTDATWGDN
ncbi:hypothetical protein ElyMa_005398100 [Elysia marginata]|uniref:Uncharacterized protein n=1 Tax=Elysia marginata TaxID=1093978 RepID=A0AAV4EG43_9GAST|nr:hypothetical protein ElyMa_005398100 [Elysia marginata]